MTARANPKRVNSSLTCETLEQRQLLSSNIAAFAAAEVRAAARAGPLDRAPSLFVEPQAGRAPIVQAINAARSEIRLGICNLSDPQIGDALADAVVRGVNVKVIVDQVDRGSASRGASPPDHAAESDWGPDQCLLLVDRFRTLASRALEGCAKIISAIERGPS